MYIYGEKQLMKKNIDNKRKIRGFYEGLWSDTDRIHRSDENLALGWHLGFYEKGIKTQKEAMINMNDFVGRLLDLDNEKLMKILDAGCGVGATSIYLANKYPNVAFIGITLASNEIALAEKSQREKHVNNTKFMRRSFINTGFPNEYFDCVFALESVSCTKNKKKFLDEMYKILKPGGKIVIIDFFRKHDSFVKNMRYNFLRQLEFPLGNVSIKTFKSYHEIEGFGKINICNLLRTGNVKYLHLYGFIISSIFQNSYANLQSQFKESIKDRKYNLVIYFFRLKSAFFVKFILECLLLLIAKPGYYFITAVKK